MIKIGIIDSGFETVEGNSVAFFPDGSRTADLGPHALDHGKVIASFIRTEGVELLSAKVFHNTLSTSARQVAEALGYLSESGVSLIHMSLGLPRDDEQIARACRRFIASGGILVASTPSMGSVTVYPAAYDGVVRVCADGRCENDEIRLVGTAPLRYGASPYSSHPQVRGSSVAAARVCGRLTRWLTEGVERHDVWRKLATEMTR